MSYTRWFVFRGWFSTLTTNVIPKTYLHDAHHRYTHTKIHLPYLVLQYIEGTTSFKTCTSIVPTYTGNYLQKLRSLLRTWCPHWKELVFFFFLARLNNIIERYTLAWGVNKGERYTSAYLEKRSFPYTRTFFLYFFYFLSRMLNSLNASEYL